MAEASWMGMVEAARQLGPDPELAGLSDEEVELAVREGASRVAAMTCKWLEHVAEMIVRGCWGDQGASTPGVWLAWACGTSPGTSREYVRVGLALRSAPLVRQRFAAGTLSYSKVRAITRVVAPQTEQSLVELADSATAAQLERIIAGCRHQLNEQERWQRGPDDAVEVRDFRRVEVDPDTVEFRIRMSVADAEGVEGNVERLVELADRAEVQAGLDHGREGAVGRAGHVPIGVRRAAALCDGLAAAVAAGPPDRSGADGHLVVVHVDSDDLAAAIADPPDTAAQEDTGPAGPADHPDGPAGSADPTDDPDVRVPASRGRRTGGAWVPGRRHVASGRGRAMSVPARVLARLACDADLRIAGIDGHGGHPADIGRRSRKVPPDLRRALLLRDRHCRFPGCDRTRNLHAHHVLHWALGGPTDLANLLTVCAFHHRYVHDHGWTLQEIDGPAGCWSFHEPGQADPHPAVLAMPGVSAETLHGGCDPDPRALEPPWWDPGYDLSETIRVVTNHLADLDPPASGRPDRYPGIATTIAA